MATNGKVNCGLNPEQLSGPSLAAVCALERDWCVVLYRFS